jgi:hypothetical protein
MQRLCLCLLAGATLAVAQSPGYNAWLMKNYHFTGPPPAASLQPVDPVVSELRQIQGTLTSIMRKADFAEDWETAIIAGTQAIGNAQLIGLIGERQQAAAAAAAPKTAESQPTASSPVYTIALKDRTIDSAMAWWVEGRMLNYLTPRGSHVQVRLDLVDRDLTARINRARNLELNLPQ